MEDAAPQTGSRIFISYRREDSAGHVLALLPPLRRRFGADRVFKDTDNIPPGEDFLKFIKRELESCSVLLAIIGREWLTVQDPRLNRRRLDNPEDFLRVEVGTALSRDNIRVIPVLVERATMPAAGDLPPDLAPLSYRNAIELSDVRWESDVQLLIDAIERWTGEPTAVPPQPQPAAAKPLSAGAVRPEVIELQKRRARDIAAHLATAQQAMEAQDYDAALQACEKVLLLDPEQRDALDLLDRARKAIDERKIAAWLQQAQLLLNRGEVGDSSDLIDQALAVDNTSEAALALRKEMLNYRRERERERNRAKTVRAATDQARACLDDGDFESAIRYADHALTANPEAAEARESRNRAEAAIQERRTQRELRRRAQQAVSEARELIGAGDAAEALRKLREFSPPHDLVTHALQQLQTDVDAVEACRQQILELTKKAEAATRGRQFDKAVAALSEALQLEPRRPDIAALLADATRKQSAGAAAQRTLADAAVSFGREDYDAARQLVEAARAQDPRHPELDGWIERIDRAVEAQAAAVWRSETIRTSLSEAKDRLAKGDLTIALRQVDAALALDPAHAEAQELAQQVRAAVAEQREREEHERRAIEATDHARRLFDAEDHTGALGTLERFTPPHPRVTQALASLREELRAIEARRRQQQEETLRRQQELERARAARERAEALRRILTRGEANLEKGDHAAALRDADEALDKEPESTAARELRARAEALRDRLAREERDWREQERLDQERQQREREELERQARERQEQQRKERERQERERKLRERRDAERKEQERIERARQQQEQEERERQHAAALPGTAPVGRVPDIRTPAGEHVRPARFRVGVWLAAAAAVILAAAIGTWYYGKTKTSEPAARAPRATSSPPPAAKPSQTVQPSQTPSGQPPATAELPPPSPDTTSAPGSPPPAVAEGPSAEEVRRQQLEKLRATVRVPYEAGQRVRALDAAVAALRKEPDDPALKSMLGQLLADAIKGGQQSKRRAIDADAPSLAKETYGQGLKLEDAGNRVREEDQAAATRSFWRAADRFDAAAREAAETAKKLARAKPLESEIPMPMQLPPPQQPQPGGTPGRDTNPGSVTTTPPRPAGTEPEKRPDDRKVPDNPPANPEKPPAVEPPKPQVPAVNEEARIAAVLDRYQAAYDDLDADAVRSVYPTVRSDLREVFGTYQFYLLDLKVERVTISADGQTAVARCRLFHNFRPKISAKDLQRGETQDISLQKVGSTWVIVGLRNR